MVRVMFRLRFFGVEVTNLKFLCVGEDGGTPKVPLTSCYNSTIAESLVHLLRHLHSFPSWAGMMNNELFCNSDGNNYVAALALLGGVTNKPRIGGDVIMQDGSQGLFSNMNRFRSQDTLFTCYFSLFYGSI